jgi:hypothetical protein
VDIGLIDGNRKLTTAGQALLDIVERGAFDSDNQLRIANDSYIYLKQVAKTTAEFNGGLVRPYIVAAYLLTKFGELSNSNSWE